MGEHEPGGPRPHDRDARLARLVVHGMLLGALAGARARGCVLDSAKAGLSKLAGFRPA
jgi:hypothetical protein